MISKEQKEKGEEHKIKEKHNENLLWTHMWEQKIAYKYTQQKNVSLHFNEQL